MNENELFAYLKQHFIQDLEHDKEQFTCFDCKSNEKKVFIELKCRRKHYEELMIEREKYNTMVKKAGEVQFIPVYINSTPKGVWGFNLLDIKIEWKQHFMPKHTDFDKNQSVKKEVGYLHISKAKNLTKPEFFK